MKAEKFNHPLLNMMNSPSSAADVWTRKQPETDTENKESVDDVNLPPVHTYDELKKMRRNAYIKMVAIVGIIVTALVFGSVAWFTESREVEGSAVQMTGDNLPFEIVVTQAEHSAAESAYNSKIEQLGYDTQQRITGEKSAIRWVMTDESENNTNTSLGIRPGSYGSFVFYIYPKDKRDMTIEFSLNATGYYAEFDASNEKQIKDDSFISLTEKAKTPEDGATELTSKYTKAANFLKGHILFFLNHDVLAEDELNETTDVLKYYDERLDSVFTYDTAEHQNDKVLVDGKSCYKVEIFWIWPNTFGQILFDKGNKNLYDTAMFSSLQSNNPRSEMLNYISSHGSYFFMSNVLSSKTKEQIASMMTSEALSNTDALITLSNGYNSADQIIGENVKFVFTEIQTTNFAFD